MGDNPCSAQLMRLWEISEAMLCVCVCVCVCVCARARACFADAKNCQVERRMGMLSYWEYMLYQFLGHSDYRCGTLLCLCSFISAVGNDWFFIRLCSFSPRHTARLHFPSSLALRCSYLSKFWPVEYRRKWYILLLGLTLKYFLAQRSILSSWCSWSLSKFFMLFLGQRNM